jgi:hypothetical protein
MARPNCRNGALADVLDEPQAHTAMQVVGAVRPILARWRKSTVDMEGVAPAFFGRELMQQCAWGPGQLASGNGPAEVRRLAAMSAINTPA